MHKPNVPPNTADHLKAIACSTTDALIAIDESGIVISAIHTKKLPGSPCTRLSRNAIASFMIRAWSGSLPAGSIMLLARQWIWQDCVKTVLNFL